MARSRLTVVIILIVAMIFGLLFARQRFLTRSLVRPGSHTLRVLTYSTFVGSSGPGRELEKIFEQDCNCEVEYTSAGDAGLLLERLRLSQSATSFDVVIGLDTATVQEAEKNFKWKELFFGSEGRHPIVSESVSRALVPYDWSPLTFVYRQGEVYVPVRFDDLLDTRLKNALALQDPHSSSPGLQFLNWVRMIKGDGVDRFLQSLKANINSISPSWAFSYGLFQKKQTQFVFSYLTSLAFHWGVDHDRQFRVVSFPEGHPVQIEYAGVPATCGECDLAEKFVTTMLRPDVQKLIMERNFMFPVIRGLEQGSVFSELPELKVIATSLGKDFSDWDKVFKR